MKLKDFETKQRHCPQWTMVYQTLTAALPGFSDLGQSGSKDLERLKSHSSNIYSLIRSFTKR